MRSAISRSLRGFQVSVPDIDENIEINLIEAASAEEAEVLIKEKQPHIALLDQKLPGKTGIELMEELSEDPDAPLIVMITAYATIETAIQATKRGAYDFLPKPFTPDELRSTLRKAVEHVVVTLQARRLEAERRQVRFQFISVLAHELKAPLNAVQGYIDLLEDQHEGLAKEDREMIFQRSALRLRYMRKMIDDLLDLTRIESGQKKREISAFNLSEVLEMTVETAMTDARERGISIETVTKGEIPFLGDRNEIEIILNNLVSNAVKYNRDKGTVTVKITDEDGGVEIEVTDTGIGMSEVETEKLFSDFVRIKNEKTRSIPGSGLGLSIVKKIAQLYSGDVSVRSTPDVGSTFTVHLHPAEESAE